MRDIISQYDNPIRQIISHLGDSDLDRREWWSVKSETKASGSRGAGDRSYLHRWYLEYRDLVTPIDAHESQKVKFRRAFVTFFFDLKAFSKVSYAWFYWPSGGMGTNPTQFFTWSGDINQDIESLTNYIAKDVAHRNVRRIFHQDDKSTFGNKSGWYVLSDAGRPKVLYRD